MIELMTGQDKGEIAEKLGMEILRSIPLEMISLALAKKIPYAFARKHLIVPLSEEENYISIAIADPLNMNAIEELRMMLDLEVVACYCPQEQILAAINNCYKQGDGAASAFLANLNTEEKKAQEGDDDPEVYDLLSVSEEQAPIIRLLNLIFSEAVSQGASDIHFEPYEDDLKIRYRIDGVLQKRHSPPREFQSQLLTRIKVLAKLDIAEHRLPQDGRMKLRMGGREIDFRISTVPVAHGERIVLRILDKGNLSLGLDQLGLLPSVLDDFKRLISLSEGIILVTGPTGSGKTTTLYSTLWELYNEEVNMMTIEDPVEYRLKGIAQIAVHPKIGLTFAKGLRHILRQDPDVVMLGEIRDQETAEIAIQAALTGHLVFSTLHTNDAPSAITRLVDMGIEPYLLSATIVGVLAQRLVRRICPECRERYIPTDAELQELGTPRDELIGGVLYRGKGCDSCFGMGYKGRCGIYELMTIPEKIRSMIAARAELSDIRDEALKHKMVSLRAHGAHLVKSGVTTLSELMRVSRKYET